MPSAKQRAWRAKFAEMARSGKLRKKGGSSGNKKGKRSGKAKTHKTNRRQNERNMGKKRNYGRRRNGAGGKALLKNLVLGMGAATLIPGLPGAAVGYVLGGPVAAGGALFGPQLRNMVGSLTGRSGGGNGAGY